MMSDQPTVTDAREIELFGPDYPASTEMFPVHVALREDLQRHQEDLSAIGFSDAERRTLNRDLVTAVREAGVDAPTARPIIESAIQAALNVRRGATTAPEDAAQRDEETMRALRREYGADYERLSARVETFLQQQPKFAAWLQGDVGKQVHIRRALLEHVRKQQFR